ncbi:unnamed protein product [Prorocentrum cordatum]|uniref:Mei2-like C-terminal RNA recognition motif domain-containing protein n=1 Tax=Prorocentrum cordatum TaxID=2364126 RepID=A0ABN9Q5Y1_9DINO|nr:unnamed protein product [Polarella glacialis]
MSTVFCTSAILRPGARKEALAHTVDILDILPLKVRLAEDGSRITGTDTGSASDTDHSYTDEDLAVEPRLVEPIGLPPGLAPPPGLGLEVADGFVSLGSAVSAAERTPLRSRATLYSPLSSGAEAFVPKSLSLAQGRRPRLGGAGPKAPGWTTVMMRNIPFSYTCDSVIALLESRGFSGWFDFVYVPIKRTEALGVGYAFINVTSPQRAEEFMLAWEGFDEWTSSGSGTACSMCWSVCQGLRENISRYRNSPFMRDNVPAIYKPVLMKDGVRIPFPKPTRPLQQDRSQRYRNVQKQEDNE